jgi:hypothetical protein
MAPQYCEAGKRESPHLAWPAGSAGHCCCDLCCYANPEPADLHVQQILPWGCVSLQLCADCFGFITSE